MKGIKVIVQASNKHLLALQLRRLATEVEEGNAHMNMADGDGLRMMRQLRDDEKTFYLDAREMP